MPRAPRIWAALFAIGLMAAGCTDPASLTNDIQAVDDVTNTNAPRIQERGLRSVGNFVMSPVAPTPSPSPTPSPAPTPRPTAAPTPTPSPSGPITLP